MKIETNSIRRQFVSREPENGAEHLNNFKSISQQREQQMLKFDTLAEVKDVKKNANTKNYPYRARRFYLITPNHAVV